MATQGNLFIEELYAQIELEMLQNIGKVLGNGAGVTEEGVLNWQVEKLAQLGRLNQYQLDVLAKYTGLTEKELLLFIQETALGELVTFNNDEVVQQLDYVEPTNQLYERLVELEKQALDTSNKVNSSLIANTEQVYRDIVTESSARVLLGNTTLQEELTRSIREWAKLGIPVLEDKSGRKWSTEAYMNMVIRSTQKNTAVAMQEQRMEEYGIDLLEISSHAGSRPSHIEYQGKIYSRSGRSKLYPPLSDTNYGRIDGIVTGIHCGHFGYVYVHGKSRKRYDPYDKKTSIKQYEESQKQRRLEREIRREKKALEALESMGMDEKTIREQKERVRKKQAIMRAFVEETGRTRRRNREQIVNVGKEVAPKGERKVLSQQEFLEKAKKIKR